MDDDTHAAAIVQEPRAPFLTPKDLQRELQIGEKLVYRLLQESAIPSVRFAGLYRTPRAQLEEALLTNPSLEREKRHEKGPADQDRAPKPSTKGIIGYGSNQHHQQYRTVARLL